jgi:hypothetical protein
MSVPFFFNQSMLANTVSLEVKSMLARVPRKANVACGGLQRISNQKIISACHAHSATKKFRVADFRDGAIRDIH